MNILSLPTQSDMDIFLAEFFNQYPSGKFYLARLTQEAKDFFSVTEADAALPCMAAHGCTSVVTTRLEQLTHWGCIHLLDKHTIKRTAPNEYQHMAGPDKLYLTHQERQAILDEATAFFKHSHSLGFTLEQTKVMWSGRWDTETVAKATAIAFS